MEQQSLKECTLEKRADHKSIHFNHYNSTVRKKWRYTTTWLKTHIEILEKVIPGRVIAYGGKNGDVFIDFTYIEGIPANQFEVNNVVNENYFRQIITFWISNAAKTFPYAHWDWHPGNTIILPCTQNLYNISFEMIDWDNCRKTTIEQVQCRLIECVGIAYKQQLSQSRIDEIQTIFNEQFGIFTSS